MDPNPKTFDHNRNGEFDMNIIDTQTALKIWPDKMPAPYAEAIERAKAWLGKRYLLAEPLNRPAPLPALLRRQAE